MKKFTGGTSTGKGQIIFTTEKVGDDCEKQRIVSAKIVEKVLPYKASGV
jgi:hypothetical protein